MTSEELDYIKLYANYKKYTNKQIKKINNNII